MERKGSDLFAIVTAIIAVLGFIIGIIFGIAYESFIYTLIMWFAFAELTIILYAIHAHFSNQTTQIEQYLILFKSSHS